jgi:hypothetical protein
MTGHAYWIEDSDGSAVWRAISEAPDYPYTNAAGVTVWACCESSIGPVCGHLREPEDDPDDFGGVPEVQSFED